MQHVRPQGGASGPRARTRGGGLLLREVAVPGGFVATILLTNYAMTGLPNVKLFDLLVFVAGYALGFRRGVTVAVGAWLVYGNFNPWGATHVQLLLTLMAAETGYAGAGVLMRLVIAPSSLRLRPSRATVGFVAAALIATVSYDVAANLYTGYFWATIAGSAEYGRWIGVALFNPGALFFMAAHAGSNLVMFPVFAPPLIKGVQHLKERRGWA